MKRKTNKLFLRLKQINVVKMTGEIKNRFNFKSFDLLIKYRAIGSILMHNDIGSKPIFTCSV